MSLTHVVCFPPHKRTTSAQTVPGSSMQSRHKEQVIDRYTRSYLGEKTGVHIEIELPSMKEKLLKAFRTTLGHWSSAPGVAAITYFSVPIPALFPHKISLICSIIFATTVLSRIEQLEGQKLLWANQVPQQDIIFLSTIFMA